MEQVFFQNCQPWVTEGLNILLKVNDFRPSLPVFVGVRTVIVVSSMCSTQLKLFDCPLKDGLTRQYTLIDPKT